MLFSKWTIIVLFIILINYQVQPIALPVAWAVFNIMDLVVGKIGYSIKTGKPIKLFGSVTNDMLGELMGKVDKLSTKLDVMNDRLLSKLNKIEGLIKNINKDAQKNGIINQVMEPMKEVKSRYNELHTYAMMESVPEKRLNTFIQEVTDTGKKGLEQELKNLYKIIVIKTGNPENEFHSIMSISANSGAKERCGGGSSPQHTLYSLYLNVIATELLGFTTIVYSYKLKEGNETKPETGKEIQFLAGAIKDRIKEYSTEFSNLLSTVQRDLRTCDPVGNHVREETYTEMWGLIQGILLFEYDLIHADTCSYECKNLNGPRPDQPCRKSVDSYTGFHLDGTPNYIDSCSTPRKCFGHLNSCYSLRGAEYCELENNPRRYVYVNGEGGTFGKVQECNGTKGWLSTETYWAYTCESCFCMCNDDQPDSASVHIVSLKESVSDSKNNMVVVGVKIRVYERILHLQVKESKIIEQYLVDHNKTSWVELPSMKNDVYQAHKYPGRPSNRFVRNRDFAAWNLDESAFNLDNIIAEHGRVVTGVKFQKSTKSEDRSEQLELQVQSTEYDPTSGKLKAGTEKWEKSSKIHKAAVQFPYLNPVDSKEETEIDADDSMYVRLSRSDFWADAAQTTIPLFDAQTVEANPNAPLAGFGIHHRGTLEEAGFIGLTAYSINFAEYIKNAYESGESDFANSTLLEEPE